MVLYKKDSKGKIRVTEYTTDGALIIMKSGLLGGKLKETTVPCKAKNVGRSNETTAEKQAQLEMDSRISKKLDEGYFYSVEEAQSTVVILPMLAQSYNPNKHEFPFIASGKLDGMRALFIPSTGKFISRKGKDITTVNHIRIINLPDNVIAIDGELYSHGDDFQTNMKLIKKYRKGETERVKFHIYDVITDKPLTYAERFALICTIEKHNSITIVPTKHVSNEEELNEHHTDLIGKGYEGTMLRVNKIPYEVNKRSHSLLKFKDFIDETYEIIDVVPNDKATTQGTIVVSGSKKGMPIKFKCGMRMSHKDREELLINKDKYIGLVAEVRFFEYSQDGVPRFPVCVGIRLDK